MGLSYDQSRAAVRAEIAKLYDGEFSDDADLCTDLAIHSDDLSAIGLTLEKMFGIKLSQGEYREITTVERWAAAIQRAAAG